MIPMQRAAEYSAQHPVTGLCVFFWSIVSAWHHVPGLRLQLFSAARIMYIVWFSFLHVVLTDILAQTFICTAVRLMQLSSSMMAGPPRQRQGQTESGSAMILNRVPEEEQFTESLRSMPKDKPFSISFAFPEAVQTWHKEVMDEFWQHLEKTTGAHMSIKTNIAKTDAHKFSQLYFWQNTLVRNCVD